MASRDRISDQPAFLLHSVPYMETSLVLDLFTRDHGRIGAVAKGAKRPHSALRPVLLQFQHLRVGYTGRNELRTLTAAEWTGRLASPKGYGLLCAFYLNELLIKLLARDDPYPELFDGYQQALTDIAAGAQLDDTLRRFEWLLLRETGYCPDLERDNENQPIKDDIYYSWVPASGFLVAEPGSESIRGQALQDIATLEWTSDNSRQQAKYLTRRILNHCLDGAELNTRKIMLDLQRL
ncbi:MAG: DNA repair protein RecO [Burkholderiaceae bacterium]